VSVSTCWSLWLVSLHPRVGLFARLFYRSFFGMQMQVFVSFIGRLASTCRSLFPRGVFSWDMGLSREYWNGVWFPFDISQKNFFYIGQGGHANGFFDMERRSLPYVSFSMEYGVFWRLLRSDVVYFLQILFSFDMGPHCAGWRRGGSPGAGICWGGDSGFRETRYGWWRKWW